MVRPVRKRRSPRVAERAASGSTRDRLLDAAGEMFAARGFYETTVEQICSGAGANIAAVNYHFKDKLHLYSEVLRRISRTLDVRGAISELTGTPEEVLRQVIRMRLRSLLASDAPDRGLRLMMHESIRSTAAMGQLVNETLRPMNERFREIVGAVLGLPRDHDTTRLCVLSIIGQTVYYVQARPLIARLWPGFTMTPEQVDQIADHITDFSLAYLRAVKSGQRPEPAATKGRG